MLHGLNNTYLYSAKKILTKCTDGTTEKVFRGTGFFVEKEDDIYFITNRHMVEPDYSNPRYSGYKLMEFYVESYEGFDADGLPLNLRMTKMNNFADFKFHSNDNNDVACLKNPTFSGGITANSAIPFSLIATEEWISQKLLVCDTIAYPGFPEWFDRQNNTPIFRMGTVASDPRLNYSYDPSAPIASRIAYEGFSTNGSSGSPVFAVQRGFPIGEGLSAPDDFYREVKFIGINAGHFFDQNGHSGISYCFKSSVIHDIINSN